MTGEFFDVVNERDEVSGRAARGEIHARGLLHRSAHALVFNPRGEVYLQKRSRQKDREPGLWSTSAAGHLESGEDYDAAMLREMVEELGWQPSRPPERVLRLEACAETDQEFVWVYRCAGEGPFTLHRAEVEAGGWFAPVEVDRWLAARPEEFTAAFRVIWRKLRTG